MAWKDHVAQAMKGKKFGSRQEANEFMKKLSAEWKSKKGGDLLPQDAPSAESLQRPPVKRAVSKKAGYGRSMVHTAHMTGSGVQEQVDDIINQLSDEDKQELAAIVEKFLKKKQGRGASSLSGMGTTTPLLKPGLAAPGVHLSELPK